MNNASQNTPWTTEVQFVSAEKKQKTGIIIIRDASQNVVAQTTDKYSALIAAALELLEASRHAAMSAHHPYCKHHGQTSRCTCHVGKAIAAIAKAEGK